MAEYYPLPTWKPSTLIGAYKAAIIADAPRGYWQLGEALITDPAVDAIATYPGTYFTNDQNPDFNQAGINGVNNNSAVNFNSGSGMAIDGSSWAIGAEASYEAWIKTANTGDNRRRIISIQYGYGGGYIFMALEGGFLEYGDSGLGIEVKGAVTLYDGAWHHVVITKKNNNNIYWYVDGSPVDYTPLEFGCSSIDETPQIGRTSLTVQTNYGALESFLGVIDEVAIYDYVLTSVQVAAHYNLGKY